MSRRDGVTFTLYLGPANGSYQQEIGEERQEGRVLWVELCLPSPKFIL